MCVINKCKKCNEVTVFDIEDKALKKAIELAYNNKLALYLYPDCIIIKETTEEDCYLSKTTIIEAEYYDTFESFNKEVNEIYNFKMNV